MNLYVFVGNDGVNWADALGLATLNVNGAITPTTPRRDCSWNLYVSHAGGESGHGINKIAETDQSKMPCGDRLGFVSCNATFLNGLIDEAHRIPNAGQGVESNLQYHPEDYRAMVANIKRANKISKNHIPTPKREDTRQSFVGVQIVQTQVENAKAQAEKECLKKCSCCKTITITTLCSPRLSEDLLRQLGVSRKLPEQGRNEPDHLFLERVRNVVDDEFPCDKKITVDCMKVMNSAASSEAK